MLANLAPKIPPIELYVDAIENELKEKSIFLYLRTVNKETIKVG
jgi:hypothetical protein